LCALDNPPPVRALYVDWPTQYPNFLVRGDYNAGDQGLHSSADLYPASRWPAGAPVGNDHGSIEDGIAPGNTMPWCLRVPKDPTKKSAATSWVSDAAHFLNGRPMPFCPESVVPPSDNYPPNGDGRMTSDDIDRWTYRGAINAGMSVFLYLDDLVKRGATPQPRYDQCELLP
jgi:hypothetical protein